MSSPKGERLGNERIKQYAGQRPATFFCLRVLAAHGEMAALLSDKGWQGYLSSSFFVLWNPNLLISRRSKKNFLVEQSKINQKPSSECCPNSKPDSTPTNRLSVSQA